MSLDRRRFVGVALAAAGSAALGGCASLVALRVPVERGRVRIPLAGHPRLATPLGFLKLQPEGHPDPVFVLSLGGDAYAAVSPICTHRGCTVDVSGAVLECPCHGSTYDRHGRVLEGPAERPLHRHPCLVEDGVLVIDLSESA